MPPVMSSAGSADSDYAVSAPFPAHLVFSTPPLFGGNPKILLKVQVCAGAVCQRIHWESQTSGGIAHNDFTPWVARFFLPPTFSQRNRVVKYRGEREVRTPHVSASLIHKSHLIFRLGFERNLLLEALSTENMVFGFEWCGI